jgi:hypothetical protein
MAAAVVAATVKAAAEWWKQNMLFPSHRVAIR